ncbi:Nudix hydrolase 17, mitochondrial [Morella rubra]|uniref:Nudix hydrolase 17, mitochondrial n=1 Tax=Morella rubra TaxID=262757 RepID=A0A6A1V1S9_9ROSI|nr:Nudix hydrolase 17, mitochondrial [Morella rubra]
MVCVVSRTGRELQRYNQLGCRQVAGCIPYRYKKDSDGKSNSNDIEVLVISSQKGQGQGLTFPKARTAPSIMNGGWELDESLEEAALRESLEEAGVRGNVQCELGKWTFISRRYGTCYEGYMFPMLVEEQLDLWPEKNVRRRIWMTAAEAREVCRHEWMKEALDKLVERLTFPEQQKEDDAQLS